MEFGSMDEKGLLSLFQKMKEGDRNAFSILYQHTWRRLFDLALAKTHDEDEAKDIVQDIFVALWDKRERLDIRLNVEGYLLRTTHYEVIRRLRNAMQISQKEEIYKQAIDGLSQTLEDLLLAKELRLQWETEIAKLPQKQREIYSLHYQLSYSITEIARELGIAEQTVKNQLVSANKKIRPIMESSLMIMMCLWSAY